MIQPGLLERVRAEARTRRFSYPTEQDYGLWITKFIHVNPLHHPLLPGKREIPARLSRLAVELQVPASTQNQALSVILFLS